MEQEMEHDHTHEEQVEQPEGYFPPTEIQVQMLRQENVALNEANLNLRMQTSFQTQIINQLREQIARMAEGGPAEPPMEETSES
jgi:hypothetical protein